MSKSRSPCVLLLTAVAIVASLAGRARAAPTQLICQTDLTHTDCTTVTGSWPAAQPLVIKASCQECTGSGADLKCSSAEQLSASVLSLETAKGVTLAGTFSQVGACIGVPLWQFSGTLVSGELRFYATLPTHGRNLLLTFNVTGGAPPPPPPADGGTPPGDSGGSGGDHGTSSGTADGNSSSGGGDAATLDVGGGGGAAGDGGCGCQSTPGAGGGLALALLLLLLVAAKRRAA